MSFVHCLAHKAKPAASGICIVIQGDRMLAAADTATGVQLPVYHDLEAWREIPAVPLHVGLHGARPLWLYTIESADTPAPNGWSWHETRALLSAFTPAQMHAVSCARELHWWQTRNRFCGCCGTPTIDMPEERAKKCPACSSMFFPNISPAVIVAITRGDQLLLGHNRNFRPGMFSLLAGFIDPGETAEQAVTREVREEVGIEIGGLRYITSQPWPFPNSLMLGFRAHHVSGEVVVDGKEIEQAGWFTRETLPEIPRVGTVARSIIDGWLRE